MRARLPDESGYVVNSGVRIHYEVHGTGQQTLLLLPTWAIVDSRHWKMQVPFLARNYRVITFDPRGNGRSDRPRDPAAYAETAFASDIRAVLDATGTERAMLAGFCTGFTWALLFATAEPQRVTGIVAIAPTLPIPPVDPWERSEISFDFDAILDTTEGWAKENRHYWRRDWQGYVEFFMSQIATEPHSTKPYDDLVEWGMQTDARPVSGRGEPRDPRLRRRAGAQAAQAGPLAGHRQPPPPGAVDLLPDRPWPCPAGPGHSPRRPQAHAGPGDPLVGAAAGDRCARRGRRDHSPGELRDGLRVGALGVRGQGP